MRRIHITCASGAMLHGFMQGIEYANDSGLEVAEYSRENGTLLLVDRDVDEEEELFYELTAEGLQG